MRIRSTGILPLKKYHASFLANRRAMYLKMLVGTE
jgi:hypothetical protein